MGAVRRERGTFRRQERAGQAGEGGVLEVTCDGWGYVFLTRRAYLAVGEGSASIETRTKPVLDLGNWVWSPAR